MVMNFGWAWSNDQIVYLSHDKTFGRLTMQGNNKAVCTIPSDSANENKQKDDNNLNFCGKEGESSQTGEPNFNRLEEYQRLIVSATEHFDLTFYNQASKRFLCFEHHKKRNDTKGKKIWRLVGVRNPKNCSMCLFKEQLELNGYHTYHYVDEEGGKHFLNFKKNGHFSDTSINIRFMKQRVLNSQNETTIKSRNRHNRHNNRYNNPRKCIDRLKKDLYFKGR